MKSVINWFLNLTKVGKVVSKAQETVSGYKSYLAGLGIAIPALITIVTKFSDQGGAYLLTVTSTPEWALLLNGLGIMGLRAAISKAGNGAALSSKP